MIVYRSLHLIKLPFFHLSVNVTMFIVYTGEEMLSV